MSLSKARVPSRGRSFRRIPEKRCKLLAPKGGRAIRLAREDLYLVRRDEFHCNNSFRLVEAKELLVVRKDHPANLDGNELVAQPRPFLVGIISPGHNDFEKGALDSRS